MLSKFVKVGECKLSHTSFPREFC